MVTIEIKISEVIEDYPEIIEEYMNNLRQSKFSNHKNIDIDKIRWFYTYGSFKTKGSKIDFEMSSKLLFDERLEFELSKIRIDVAMKASNFIRSDRAKKGFVPKSITGIITEITKVRMLLEQKYYKYLDVIESIPVISPKFMSQKEIDKINDALLGNDKSTHSEIQYNVDEILDKINDEGINSLDSGELDFLNNISKDDK